MSSKYISVLGGGGGAREHACMAAQPCCAIPRLKHIYSGRPGVAHFVWDGVGMFVFGKLIVKIKMGGSSLK